MTETALTSGYTVFRVTLERTMPLLRRHALRLDAPVSVLQEVRASLEPGIYRAWWTGTSLATERVSRSRLQDGMTTRTVASPIGSYRGTVPKRPSPNAYDSVRLDGIATLLTTEDRTQWCESCTASLVAWNGTSIVLVQEETPRVASLTEAAIAQHFSVVRAPIRSNGNWPVLLSNAVVGTCAVAIDRPAFPADIRQHINELLLREDA